jgi:hypothetical protein
MPDVWRIYRVKNCRHTHPPKDKFTIIVCKDDEYLGFLVNSTIAAFIEKNPHLLECQVRLSKLDYGFLFYDSFLDCIRPLPFDEDELVIGLEMINPETKAEIKKVVAKSDTIEKRYIDKILSSP